MEKPPLHAIDRFRELVEHLGAQLGRKRGWHARVAESIGITPEHLSRTMAGKVPLARVTLLKAAASLGLNEAYFYEDAPQDPDRWKHGGSADVEYRHSLDTTTPHATPYGPIMPDMSTPIGDLRTKARALLAKAAKGAGYDPIAVGELARAYIESDTAYHLARRVLDKQESLGDFLGELARDQDT